MKKKEKKTRQGSTRVFLVRGKGKEGESSVVAEERLPMESTAASVK